MPRKDFVRDLETAINSAAYSGFSHIGPGEDDGVFSCTFTFAENPEKPVDIQCLIPDVSDYPEKHDCFVYTTSDDIPRVAACLEKAQPRLRGLRVADVLLHLSNSLNKALSLHTENNSLLSDDARPTPEGESDSEIADIDSLEECFEDWPPASSSLPRPARGFIKALGLDSCNNPALLHQLACDLEAAKLAGFRVGYLGNQTAPIICISCRISRLEISEEAMKAWRVDGRQYLVCLIRYGGSYQSFEEILHEDIDFGKTSLGFTVDLCNSYKPTFESALEALSENCALSNVSLEGSSKGSGTSTKSKRIVRSFISGPLNSLMNERFVKVLRYRFTFGLSWEGAELLFNDTQGKAARYGHPEDARHYMQDARGLSDVLPQFVTADHLSENSGTKISFPLIAMQFALRHFVRCTEFCLVCHCKTNASFEALKPYVCSKHLCLYQYMALGFGPSLEWEILSQPDVVDLLVSFTYCSAKGSRLCDFPIGLGFLVPSKLITPILSRRFAHLSTTASTNEPWQTIDASLNRRTMKLTFPPCSDVLCLPAGTWIVITEYSGEKTRLHCRVQDVSYWPTVQLGRPFSTQPKISEYSNQNSQDVLGGSEEHDISFVVYDTNFDDLDDGRRRAALCFLLDTLPPIDDMKAYLSTTTGTSQPSLSNWKDRISKPALDVLRWIVSSNRSCIIQDKIETPSDPNSRDSIRHRVSGLSGYMQFRFAQGAPDKEQRFIQSVANSNNNPAYPTIFAWHGSPLYNWHGILREGLHYNEKLHGRAFGDGVYMSTKFFTATSYAGTHPRSAWPQSKLEIGSVISLNEVVNAPKKFVCSSPHLVVKQLEWIQTRYLFVRCKQTIKTSKLVSGEKSQSPGYYYQQDPSFTAIGPDLKPIMIPMSAFSRQRRTELTTGTASSISLGNGAGSIGLALGKKGQPTVDVMGPTGQPNTLQATKDQDGWTSDESDSDNVGILGSANTTGEHHASKTPQQVKTDFIPGTLINTTLSLLGPPVNATPAATKALQRDLKTTLQLQENSPLHELGWYIDPNLITTVYQWIAEFHSFDADLPLASDLKQAGLTSVVLELRFFKDYPISPPFIRVIRPRFLNFLHGGGGHVTAGGALCMELLTNSGWSAVSSIESVLLQVRMAMCTTDPRPARLQHCQNAKDGTVKEYGVGEAVEAYIRACRIHGWEVPRDFSQSMSRSGWSGSH
ncbi:hypothetical protein LOZ61_003649 [Ophidiomyces ophidiicola]|uniref:uncharacterized protein n=1 Tax=Ophidiomyces ophidiicola TaxID=1387563 RepID=UPI0020C1FCA5|nr:uncharacterized protein LOZ57_006038 [Ophidiomyces ophidiicola]KAI1911777.1 hypothetical protein LOZ61_003649 [Ophidiomyces ophidiicola]KAI1928443.1 hypothetical protein LOZ60_002395 [Ophidiomyces ophidiicola]KAI1939755.1 hypothetical protein LOZ57_006038 [Ophidiomyces ophidiicola]KAI2055336.1 hypothetical protein LOZ43_003786 [Ophidiomyces ophidiicola]KAI2141146.1 hypothetical protein LOZ27_004635 [Ophidiomyces ophidiicola]